MARFSLITQNVDPELWKLRAPRTNVTRSHKSLVAASFILLDTHNYLLPMVGCIEKLLLRIISVGEHNWGWTMANFSSFTFL